MNREEILKKTGGKKELLDEFINQLERFKLLECNEQLDERALEVFKNLMIYKENDDEYNYDVIQKAIQEEYLEEMKLPFFWSNKAILKDLIWKINKGDVLIENLSMRKEIDNHIIDEIIIDNFVEIGQTIDVYNKSFITDGNYSITYKCLGKDYIYYIVGKRNAVVKEQDDMHIFYNDGLEFNIMKCKHLCAGSYKSELFETILKLCRENTRESVEMEYADCDGKYI